MKVRTFRWAALITAIVLIVTICAVEPRVRGAISSVAYAVSGRVVHYFNNDVNSDHIGNNDFNFGPDRFEQASWNVANGLSDSTVSWIAANDGTGDFFESIAVDPALCAAVAVHMDHSLVLPEAILSDESSVAVGQQANAAHLHFLRDEAYWDRAVNLITSYLTSSNMKVVKVKQDSSMYMWHDGLEGNKPSVIVRYGFTEEGHAIYFDLGKPGKVMFELECGYQPLHVPYWPAPNQEIPYEPVQITAAPVVTEEPTPIPTIVPQITASPIPVIEIPVETLTPVAEHATYTRTGRINFLFDGEWVSIDTEEYHGGYFVNDDPRYAEAEFENPNAYGPTLRSYFVADTVFNWLHELPKSPLQVVRLMVQTGMIELKPLKSETDYAYQLIKLPADEYDRVVNDVLAFVYNQLNGGSLKTSKNWTLENMMKETKKKTILFGRLNGDDDKDSEEKDLLFTLFDANGRNFISSELGLTNTAKDAKVNPKDFDRLAWINADEGGTWKWKKGAPVITNPPTTPPPTPTPTPSETPTPTPTPTTPPPTPTPTPTPTSTPTPSPTPTLEPKPSDAGPQGQTEDEPGTEDFGGGPNHDTDTTFVEDPPEQPESYEPPAPPKPDPSPTPTAKPTPTLKPTVVPIKPTEKPTEKPTPSPTPELVIGDGEEHPDLTGVQEEEHDESTVEEPLQGDGPNEGDLDESEVE